ncbi:hypothetical protein Nepgr_007538 [Nepenthes gracilis]|uniref:Uncharacterized protein n=1 Tax=Nepenthes gracilis TaxID=150966 RepID=A0AAD3XIE0_NEPGR|nr:hypothetical protein Nepgr_007538 [Nepenthes gracilis]
MVAQDKAMAYVGQLLSTPTQDSSHLEDYQLVELATLGKERIPERVEYDRGANARVFLRLCMMFPTSHALSSYGLPISQNLCLTDSPLFSMSKETLRSIKTLVELRCNSPPMKGLVTCCKSSKVYPEFKDVYKVMEISNVARRCSPSHTALKHNVNIRGCQFGKKALGKIYIHFLSGTEAVSLCGDPNIQIQLGRLSSMASDPEGRTPGESFEASGLQQCFKRKWLISCIIFMTQEPVALSGTHKLKSQSFGNPTVFDQLLWLSSAGMSSMIGLPSDRALEEDDDIHLISGMEMSSLTTSSSPSPRFLESLPLSIEDREIASHSTVVSTKMSPSSATSFCMSLVAELWSCPLFMTVSRKDSLLAVFPLCVRFKSDASPIVGLRLLSQSFIPHGSRRNLRASRRPLRHRGGEMRGGEGL